MSVQGQTDYQYDELIVLREKNPEEYCPDEEQILQYAEYIGIQLPDETTLLYIAKQGIIAQLPQQWEACQTKNGQIVYRNKKNKHVQQEHPLDQFYRQEVIKARASANIGKSKINIKDKQGSKNHDQQNQNNISSYLYGINDYYDVQFDLKPISQLPSIQQDKNQLNESGVSEKLNLNFNSNDKNEYLSSNLFNQPKKKSKLLLSSLYSSKNNKSKLGSQSVSFQYLKASSTSQWDSVKELDKNIIISGSKILSGSEQMNSKIQRGNGYPKIIKGSSNNNDLNLSQQRYNDRLSKTSNNKVQVAFENLSNHILPYEMQVQMTAPDYQSQDYPVVEYEDMLPSKQFSDKFQVHLNQNKVMMNQKNRLKTQQKTNQNNNQMTTQKANPKTNQQINQNYKLSQKQVRNQRGIKQGGKLQNYDANDYFYHGNEANRNKQTAIIKKTNQFMKEDFKYNQNKLEVRHKEERIITQNYQHASRAKLVQILSNIQKEQQLKLQLLSQLQQNNQMKIQRLKKKLRKRREAQKKSKNKQVVSPIAAKSKIHSKGRNLVTNQIYV